MRLSDILSPVDHAAYVELGLLSERDTHGLKVAGPLPWTEQPGN
jgi:hypothetical protein